MVKRGRSGRVANRRFQNLVLESFEKGSTAEEIVDDLRSKDREWSRSSRHVLLLNVNQILQSRNVGSQDEEESNGRSKSRKRAATTSPSGSSWSDAVDGNVLDDDSGKSTPQFDLTNDNLRASYDTRKQIRVSDDVESLETENNKGKKFKDLGGLKDILHDLTMRVKIPLLLPQIYERLQEKPISGILLHGPPGCGKSTLARAIAIETGLPFYMKSASDVVSGVAGESEENVRKLFSEAYRDAPSVIFIDEIDAIASKRENHQKGMETRLLTQLMSCMDREYMLQKEKESGFEISGHVIVIAATNRVDALDPAMRRALRFDKEIYLGVPDEKAREEILSLITRNRPLEPGFDMAIVPRKTSGFVGADLALLVKEAAKVAAERFVYSRASEFSTDIDSLLSMQPCAFPAEEMKKLFYTTSDFEQALKDAKPSSTREGFSTIPSVTWEDVGGLDHIREEFYRHVIKPLKHPEECEGFEFCSETGFMLYGPPGCGKTLVAEAVANEAGVYYIHIKGPELLSKYVGETEKEIRKLFSRARACSPCLIFLDEFDALTTKRGSGEGAWVVERPLNQLLAEMSGGQARDGVIVIGATNRPKEIDPAVTRPGRFGKHIYLPLPNAVQRGLILKSLARKVPLDPSVDLDEIARMEGCENLSGADLKYLVKEAGMLARDDETCSKPRRIKKIHFEDVLTRIKPSVTMQQLREYDQIHSSMQSRR
ncbi:PREDICTED: cell division control protein 48 homolog C-like [Camelina sativa]|uniref:Cell division control protein 48 homolog C-like n=1 Tax=Camelina sativa TaxID=90675 RepID=A0ABM0VXY8_CAMSA|nr:PREDICTED: cell division control protein 48 homolog C-like [Camelina sativa]